jgi:hypothetical protein
VDVDKLFIVFHVEMATGGNPSGSVVPYPHPLTQLYPIKNPHPHAGTSSYPYPHPHGFFNPSGNTYLIAYPL